MKRKLFVTAMGFLIASSAHASVFEWTQEEIRTCEENAEALAFRCKIAAQDAFQELRQSYYLPQKDESYVYLLMLERETRKAAYDYISETPWDRVANKKRIDDLYQDSIDVRLLPHNDNVAGKNISMSLRFAPKMGVSTDSYNKILKLGLDVCKHIRKDPRYNYNVMVMDSLRNFLNKDQIVRVLRSKNAVQAVNKGVATWNEVKVAGLIENEDSASCCDNAIEYYLLEYVINDMYVGHDKVLKKNLSDLWKKQPLIVRMSGSLKKKEELKRKKEEEYENNEMAW